MLPFHFWVLLAFISFVLWIQACMEKDKWKWGYAGCFAVAFTAAFINLMW